MAIREFKTSSDWDILEGDICRVKEFRPAPDVEDGSIPWFKTTPIALIRFECTKFGEAGGIITHRTDFRHLWAAFKDRGVKDDEEVLICWYGRGLHPIAKLHAPFMPKLVVMICKKGAYDLITDPAHKPELTGEARFNAERPIVQWQPKVMQR